MKTSRGSSQICLELKRSHTEKADVPTQKEGREEWTTVLIPLGNSIITWVSRGGKKRKTGDEAVTPGGEGELANLISGARLPTPTCTS